jgi:hypothetical protein
MEPVAVLATPQPPPRVTRTLKKRAGRAGLASTIVVLFIPHVWVGLGLICAVVWQLAFPLIDRDVDGRVVAKNESYSSKSNSTSYSLRVAYEIDGVDGETSIGVSHERYLAAHEGDLVPLRAAHIGSFSSAQRRDGSAAPILLPFAIFWNAIVGVFVFQLAVVPLLRFWLMKRGVRVRGTITQVTRTTGKGAHVAVTYSYAVHTGEVLERTMKVSSRDADTAGPRVKDAVDVFHHPSRPRLSVIGPLTSWEIVDERPRG